MATCDRVDTSTSGAPWPASILYMLGAVVLLATINPLMKYVLMRWAVAPVMLGTLRVAFACALLTPMAVVWDARGLLAFNTLDLLKLTLLGTLGVASYAIAAWGLMHTTVTHYTLIYSLSPALTTLFAVLTGHERMSVLKVVGMGLCISGCVVASMQSFAIAPVVGFGDALVFLFTLSISAHVAMSACVVRRYGAIAANTIMFGTSTVLLMAVTMVSLAIPPVSCSLAIFSAVVYIGVATAGVFLLRYLALRTLTPGSVAACQNLVPICAVLFAHMLLNEPIGPAQVAGGAVILAGLEMLRRSYGAVSLPKRATISLFGLSRP